MTRSMGCDRAKAAAQKGQEDSSNQSEYSSVVGDMMSTLKKLNTSFTKAQLWQQWNKLKSVPP
jgi:hypothetical protein